MRAAGAWLESGGEGEEGGGGAYVRGPWDKGDACLLRSLPSFQPDRGGCLGMIFRSWIGCASLILGGGVAGGDVLAATEDLCFCSVWVVVWDSGDFFFLNTMVVVPESLVRYKGCGSEVA